ANTATVRLVTLLRNALPGRDRGPARQAEGLAARVDPVRPLPEGLPLHHRPGPASFVRYVA
ncbi:MAG: hypothetical protein ACFB11_10385, partial [Paracoccaceae bacterium]